MISRRTVAMQGVRRRLTLDVPIFIVPLVTLPYARVLILYTAVMGHEAPTSSNADGHGD